MKVPRAKSKLEVFSYKLRFNAQVSKVRECLNIITSLKEQACYLLFSWSSTKFKTVMQTILSLGNALNQGTPRDKQRDVLDFSKDLGSLEPASRLSMHYLQNEMETITKGLKNISEEVSKAKNDGHMSINFRKLIKSTKPVPYGQPYNKEVFGNALGKPNNPPPRYFGALEKFRRSAEEEVKSLKSKCRSTYLYGDAKDLIHYFEEDEYDWPWKPCCFQVATYLMKFVIMFDQAHKENIQQIEEEKKKEERRIMRMQKQHMADAFILAMLMIRCRFQNK
ncbi:formin-like protein 13 isoform X1 [Tanacetum coccineum]